MNSFTLAYSGDYLVYFLRRDENDLKCSKCNKSFSNRARWSSCPYYCELCSAGSLFNDIYCCCNYYDKEGRECCKSYNNCHDLFKKYGPFCFIEHKNVKDFNQAFENAKKNKQLYCLGCVLRNINDNWHGKLFSNIDDADFANCFELKTIRSEIFDIIESRKTGLISEYCPGHYSEVKMMLNPKYISTPKYILNPEHKK